MVLSCFLVFIWASSKMSSCACQTLFFYYLFVILLPKHKTEVIWRPICRKYTYKNTWKRWRQSFCSHEEKPELATLNWQSCSLLWDRSANCNKLQSCTRIAMRVNINHPQVPADANISKGHSFGLWIFSVSKVKNSETLHNRSKSF